MSHRTLALPLLCGLLLASRAAVAEDAAFLGVLLRPLSDELAAHLGVTTGAVVEDVLPESPARAAGLEKHDVVVAAGGAEVRTPEDLKKKIRAAKPGEELVLKVRRGGETKEFKATLATAPADARPARPAERGEDAQKAEREKDDPAPELAKAAKKGFLGVGYGEVPEILRVHLNLAEGVGVVVGDVWKGSPAQQSAIETYDVLLAIDGYDVKGPADFVRLLSEKKAEDKVKIELIHKGARKSIEVTLSERPKDLHGDIWTEPFPGAEGDDGSLQDWFPHPTRKGRVVIEGPKGQVYRFDLPDEVWQAEDLARNLGSQLKGLEQQIEKELGLLHEHLNPEELSARIKKLADELDQFKGDGLPSKATTRSSSSHSAVVRVVEDGYDITVKSQDGARTVSVVKDGNSLADNLPFDQLSSLPEEVRARVEKVVGRLQDLPQPAPVKGTSKIRA